MSEPSFNQLMKEADAVVSIAEMEFMNSVPRSLHRIGNCLEEIVKHLRDNEVFSARCLEEGCPKPNVVRINGAGWCEDHLDHGFEVLDAVKQAVRRAQEAG